MFGKRTVVDMINTSAENEADRRTFLRSAGMAGMAGVGAAALTGLGAAPASASGGPSDGAILNFALNLEYLEAEFYLHATTGDGLPANLTDGRGDRGRVVGGRRVDFQSTNIRNYAREIANDERDHVAFLRSALGSAKVARPKIDLRASFTAAARAAGLVGPNDRFDPYANENNFLLAAFLFEDVGVTAYKGAAPLIDNAAYLEAAAGILAVEAYHAGIIRTKLYDRGLRAEARAISGARDSLDGPSNKDEGIGWPSASNVVPTDRNGIAFSRTPGQVLNIVYLDGGMARRGGFFPEGVNGSLNTSAAH